MKIVIFETLCHVTLTLTSDDLESRIIVNVSSTLTNTPIWFVAALYLIVDVQTYIRMDVRTYMYVHTYGRTFLPGLLSHLSGQHTENVLWCSNNGMTLLIYRKSIQLLKTCSNNHHTGDQSNLQQLQKKNKTRRRSESAYIRQVNFVRNNGP